MPGGNGLKLTVVAGVFAVCRLEAGAVVPQWVLESGFFSVTRTAEELSIVCSQTAVPPDIVCEREWAMLKVAGPLDFGLTGILAALATPLAQAGIPIFAISTYDTDYLLVKEQDLKTAVFTLRQKGFNIAI